MENDEVLLKPCDPVDRERERLVTQLRNTQPNPDRVLSDLQTALYSDHAARIFVRRSGQPSLAEMQADLAYLRNHACDENQEAYRLKLNRLLHSVSIALAHGR